jgi:hypothetical protein
MNNDYDRDRPQQVIGIYSPAPQSGKTFTATVLVHSGFQPVSFAEPLKRMAVTFLEGFGYREDEALKLVWVDKHKYIPEIGCTARWLLQTIGTEFGRQAIAEDIWIRCWEARVRRYDTVVTDDVRFTNEAEAVKAIGGQMWKIIRPSAQRNTDHPSEGALDDWDGFDVVIQNDGSLEQFRRKIDAALWG